jgi:predicted dehydrogenase
MTLRIGIIGFGGAGQAHWSYFSCIPGCEVTKVFDPKPGGLERAAEIPASFKTCDDLLSFWTDLDVVSICSPDSTHGDYIVGALEHGLHVLCEKPLTDSFEGVCKIREATDTSDRVVAVVHQMRFVPLHRKIKRILEEKELGHISYLEGYYVHDLTERAFHYDDWRKTDNATPLVYSGVHFVDLLRWFADDEIVEVFAAANHLAFPEYPESDLNLVTLRFRSGIIGKVLVAFGTAGPQDHSVRIYGDRASIDNNILFRRNGEWGRVIHSPIVVQRKLLSDPNKSAHHGLYRQVRGNLPAYLLGKSFEALRYLSRRPNTEYGGRFYPVRVYEHALACVGAIEDFVDSVRESRKPLCTVDEASKAVLACLAGVESYRTNRPVKVYSMEEAEAHVA